jgi:hypothetical protein
MIDKYEVGETENNVMYLKLQRTASIQVQRIRALLQEADGGGTERRSSTDRLITSAKFTHQVAARGRKARHSKFPLLEGKVGYLHNGELLSCSSMLKSGFWLQAEY